MPILPNKGSIYATSTRGVLAFSQPDFSDAPLQIPGGTPEPGEPIRDGAQREFRLVTGLVWASAFEHLVTGDYMFEWRGKSYSHRRSYFHTYLERDLPEAWDHYESSPSGGGDPILFRFIWLSLRAAETELGLGMGQELGRIPGRLANIL